MSRILPLLLAALLLVGVGVPAAHVLAVRSPSSFSTAPSLALASSSPGNAYVAAASLVLTAPVAGDLSAFGGSVVTAAPVAGDALLVGGSIRSRASVGGDVRALGGDVTIDEPVKGDVAAVGYAVSDTGRVGGSVFVAAVNTTLGRGAAGPVTIYGNNVSLAGDFGDDVTIFASGRVALAASTTIRGTLSYEAPEPALIPASAVVSGGVRYTNASYLPNIGTSRILILLNLGFFLLVRLLGALILAGLLAGLFPRLAEEVVERVQGERVRSVLLTTLLGFAIVVTTPILILLLLITFVGIGLALLMSIAYALLVALALLYAGILLGGLVARRTARRETIYWRDGALGMLAFSLLTLVPVIGMPIAFLIMFFVAGTLLQLLFHFAFPGDHQTAELL